MGATEVPQHRQSAHLVDDSSIVGVPVSAQERAELLGAFLESYCNPCFGGLSKREIDLLVFQLLIRTKQIDIDGSQQSISRSLRIPIGKVKTLIYEMQLRDSRYDQCWFRTELLTAFQKARINVSKAGSYIKLGIDNPMLRKEVESRIKSLNGFADYSFNSEILKIDFEIYALLIQEIVADENERSKLKKALITAIDKKGTELLGWKELVNEFLKGAAKGAGGQAVDLTLGYLTGGTSMFLVAAKNLLRLK